jgi:hypothetical protein
VAKIISIECVEMETKYYVYRDPLIIRYTESKIRPRFSGCNRSIDETIENILNHKINLDDIPCITVVTGLDGNLYTINNRRLYVLKYLRNCNFIGEGDTIKMRVKSGLSRDTARYTVERSSLTAQIVGRKNSDCVGDDSEEAPINTLDQEGEGDANNNDMTTLADEITKTNINNETSTTTTSTPSTNIKPNKSKSDKKKIEVMSFDDICNHLTTNQQKDITKCIKLAQKKKHKSNEYEVLLNSVITSSNMTPSMVDVIVNELNSYK